MIVASFDAVNAVVLALFAVPFTAVFTSAMGKVTSPTPGSPSRVQLSILLVSGIGTAVSICNLLIAWTPLRILEVVVAVPFILLGVYSYSPDVQRWWTARSRNVRIALAAGGAGGAVVVIVVGALLVPTPSTKAGAKPAGDSAAAVKAKLLARYGGHDYLVYGTCVASSNCGLNERPKPDDHSEPMGARHPEGHSVTVVCQAKGTVVSDPPDQKSSVWDRLDNGRWVTDLYVKTPGSAKGEFSQEIEQCR